MTLGSRVREDPAPWLEAQERASEIMLGARKNVDRLYELLLRAGYVFTAPERARVLPARDVAATLGSFEERVGGPLPLSLRAWWEAVGAVDFRGTHPDWPPAYPDPIYVEGPEGTFGMYLEQLDDPTWPEQPLLDFAPDLFHKENVSGGPAYALEAPNPAVDGIVRFESHHVVFVDYLRLCFAWGGFPGFDGRAPPGYESVAFRGKVPLLVRQLADEMLPI